jgi:hypothetical protein
MRVQGAQQISIFNYAEDELRADFETALRVGGLPQLDSPIAVSVFIDSSLYN